jgi:hypothetical protein
VAVQEAGSGPVSGTLIYVHGANTDPRGATDQNTRISAVLGTPPWGGSVVFRPLNWRQVMPINVGDWEAAIPSTSGWARVTDIGVFAFRAIGYWFLFPLLFVVGAPPFRVPALALTVLGLAIGYARYYVEARDRRAGVIKRVGPQLLSDVLAYLRYRDAVFALLDEAKAQATQKPIVMMGLSLGGIMLVDYLADPDNAAGVDALVTVGSQAPLVYSFDVLPNIRPVPVPGSAPPSFTPSRVPFTPWVNIYSWLDHLSFVAGPVFEGVAGIEDNRVAGERMFPASHSEYWKISATWVHLRGVFQAAARAAEPEADRSS